MADGEPAIVLPYMKPFHLTLDGQTILEMRDLLEVIECLLISQYKYTIWLYRNRAIYKESVAKVNTIYHYQTVERSKILRTTHTAL